MLLIIRGDPGIGKTTFANTLAEITGFSVIDKDDLKDVIYPVYITDFEQCDEICYKCCLRQIKRLLSINMGVIFDDILNREWVYQELVTIAETNSKQWFILDCYLQSEQEWQRRLIKKDEKDFAGHRLKTWGQVLTWKKTRRHNFALNNDHLIKVSLDEDVSSTVEEVVKLLRIKND